MLKRGRARVDEIEFILSAVAERPQFADITSEIKKGKVSKTLRNQLEKLIHALDEESEEE